MKPITPPPARPRATALFARTVAPQDCPGARLWRGYSGILPQQEWLLCVACARGAAGACSCGLTC